MLVGENLKRLREKNKKERKEVANDNRVNYETYRRYENNKRKTPLHLRQRFAAYYNTNVGEIETGITPPVNVHELCKLIAAVKDIKDINKDMVLALAQAALDWLGKGK